LSSARDPYVAFRRRVEKMQTRKVGDRGRDVGVMGCGWVWVYMFMFVLMCVCVCVCALVHKCSCFFVRIDCGPQLWSVKPCVDCVLWHAREYSATGSRHTTQNRKNDESGYMNMLRLRRDLERVRCACGVVFRNRRASHVLCLSLDYSLTTPTHTRTHARTRTG